jgi:hypothetical protein
MKIFSSSERGFSPFSSAQCTLSASLPITFLLERVILCLFKGIWNQLSKPEWVWARERGIFQRPPCTPCFPSPPKFGLILQAVSHPSCQLHSVQQRSFSLDRCICVYIPSFSAFISFPNSLQACLPNFSQLDSTLFSVGWHILRNFCQHILLSFCRIV